MAAPDAESTPDLRLPGLRGRRAVVTGASRGIGRATAIMMARAGASVGIAYRSADGAASSAAEEARRAVAAAGVPDPASRVWTHPADLSVEAGARELFERAEEEFGDVDVFVGNAGIWNREPRSLAELSPEEWTRMIDVNLKSIYLTTREAVRRMPDGGRVVLVSSTAGQRGEPEHSHYAASKGGIISFAKSLAGELGGRGITANAVAPGWVETDMTRPVLESGEREEILAEIPLRRVARPEDVAGPICFLASDLGRQITGEVLNVNGGSVLCG